MKKATVTLWGKYKYEIKLTGKETIHDVVMKIALEVHNQEGKTKFTGVPRAYNYIYECILRKSCLNFRANVKNTKNNGQELLNACNELHNKSEFVKTGCLNCGGEGILYRGDEEITCFYCNGHGYVYEHQDYRLGYTQSSTLIIDVDGKDKDNLIKVKGFYENVLQCKFKVFETGNGYWLFSDKKYKDLQSWIFDHCKILNPGLQINSFEKYRTGLLALDVSNGKGFQRATPDIIKNSPYYGVPSDLSFDVAFTFLSIKRERSTIRITKKHKGDKIELIL